MAILLIYSPYGYLNVGLACTCDEFETLFGFFFQVNESSLPQGIQLRPNPTTVLPVSDSFTMHAPTYKIYKIA